MPMNRAADALQERKALGEAHHGGDFGLVPMRSIGSITRFGMKTLKGMGGAGRKGARPCNGCRSASVTARSRSGQGQDISRRGLVWKRQVEAEAARFGESRGGPRRR